MFAYLCCLKFLPNVRQNFGQCSSRSVILFVRHKLVTWLGCSLNSNDPKHCAYLLYRTPSFHYYPAQWTFHFLEAQSCELLCCLFVLLSGEFEILPDNSYKERIAQRMLFYKSHQMKNSPSKQQYYVISNLYKINSIISCSPQRYTSVIPNVDRTLKNTWNILVDDIEVCITELFLGFSIASFDRDILRITSFRVFIIPYRVCYGVLMSTWNNVDNTLHRLAEGFLVICCKIIKVIMEISMNSIFQKW